MSISQFRYSFIKRFTLITAAILSLNINSIARANEYEYLNANIGFANVNPMINVVKGINPIRLQSIKQAATMLAARGVAWRSIQINHTLNEEAKKLSRILILIASS